MKKLIIWYVFVGFISLLSSCSCEKKEATTIYLVRHAEKVGQLDSLSIEGLARAQSLKHTLENVKLDHIYSTDYNRTMNTALPIAKEIGLNIVNYDASDLKAFTKKIESEHKGQTILVVGHSNTTPTLVNLLLGEERLKALDEKDYDNLFILTKLCCQESNLISLNYGS